MPDIAVHASFGQEVLSSLTPGVRDVLLPAAWRFALFGPDVWFMHRPWRRREGRARRMHTTRTGAFLMALVRRCRESACREELFSYLAGFLCHYALDSTAHPYIIYVTTEEHTFPRGHMSLEHALDAEQMKRDGLWGTAHPVTGHYFPALRLPESLRPDLDRVFEDVYGWKNCWAGMNRSCRRYRMCYRLMEHPKGLAARAARLSKLPLLKSLAYSESHFHLLDPENTEHRVWYHSHDRSQSSRDSFPELREKARLKAVAMIEAAYACIFDRKVTEDELAELIGSNSYLSGLPDTDPRNTQVKSLLPSGSRD